MTIGGPIGGGQQRERFVFERPLACALNVATTIVIPKLRSVGLHTRALGYIAAAAIAAAAAANRRARAQASVSASSAVCTSLIDARAGARECKRSL